MCSDGQGRHSQLSRQLIPVKFNLSILVQVLRNLCDRPFEVDGVEYPLVKMEISRTSHPYYTGKSKLVDTAGRIDKFKNKYSKFKK